MRGRGAAADVGGGGDRSSVGFCFTRLQKNAVHVHNAFNRTAVTVTASLVAFEDAVAHFMNVLVLWKEHIVLPVTTDLGSDRHSCYGRAVGERKAIVRCFRVPSYHESATLTSLHSILTLF